MTKRIAIALAASMLLAAPAFAGDHGQNSHDPINAEHGGDAGPACTGFGPQTPRDIDSKAGANSVTFKVAPPASEMHLCNIHFHEGAEHKSKDFGMFIGEGHEGFGSGYQCSLSKKLSKAERAWSGDGVCKGAHGDLKPGDTIEVHYVHTSCNVQPGPTLGACLTDTCKEPDLRVETQVFTLVAEGGLDFNAIQSAAALPTDTGAPVEFLGSTTGPKYSDQTCSPFKVTWSVRPSCAKLNIASVGKWCEGNVFKEDHAHGVRKLVTNPDLLSRIK